MNKGANIIISTLIIFSFLIPKINAQTTLNPGDLAIVGVNANNNACVTDGYNMSGEDNIYFISFKDLETGSIIDLTDNGWERLNVNQFGDSEGAFRFEYTGATIPAGTVFMLIFRQNAPGVDAVNPDWTVTDINVVPRWLNLNSSGDQIYAMQNGNWVDGDGMINSHDAEYQNGNLIYGFNTKTAWIPFADNSGDSGLHPEVDPCFFMAPTSGITNFTSYTGSSSPTTQLEWINRIKDATNWSSYADCASFIIPSDITIIPSGISIACTMCSGCDPLTDDLVFNLPTLGGPFNVVYSDGTNDYNANNISDGHTESVTVNVTTLYKLVSITDVNGCPVYSNFEGEAELMVVEGPSATISGGGDLCTGDCVTVDIDISGGNAPYEIDMNVMAGPLVDFDFTVPATDVNTTLTICSDGILPDFDVSTLTLTVPELPGVLATLTLQNIIDDAGCPGSVDSTPLNITIYQTPDANSAGPLNGCDEGGGVASFDLTSLDNDVNGGSGNDVDWWSDMAATVSISSPYTSSSTTVYATVSTAFCTSEVVAVDLIVNPVPTANPTSDEECGNGSGFAEFDLDALEPTVNGGTGEQVNWYSDSNGNNPINSPYTTTSTVVYAEVDNGTCTSTLVLVDLTVLPLPFVAPAGPLTACDEGGGVATFDLTILENIITGGLQNGVNWYSDPVGNNPITSPYITSSTTVYAATFDVNCESETVAITLEVVEAPMANTTSDELCGDANNQALFDLEALENTINGGSGLSVSWYAGMDTAIAIPPLYLTVSTTVYAVVANGDCRSEVVAIPLNVILTPDINDLGVINECEFYILPIIQGSNLTGNQSYYDISGGLGNAYNAGDTIFSSINLYAYDINNGLCSDESLVIIIIEESQNAGEDNMVSVCAGSNFDLTDALISADSGGIFNDDDNTGALSGNFFETDGLEGNSYQFTYNIDGGIICPDDNSIITVEVVSEVSAGNDAFGTVCSGAIIDLISVLDDADAGGDFSDLDNTGSLSGSVLNAMDLMPGTYQFEYMVGDGIVCPEDQSLLAIDVLLQPTVSVLFSTIICDGDCREIEFIFLGLSDFEYTFNLSNNDDIDETITLTSSTNVHVVPICNLGMTPGYTNDTLQVNSNQGLNWTISIIEVTDGNNCRNDDLFSFDFEIGGPGSEVDLQQTLCTGESIMVGNTEYNEVNPTGTEILLTSLGCDSIINVDLTFQSAAIEDINSVLCFGQTLTAGGELFDENNPAGQVFLANGSVGGCDSIINVDLTFSDASFNIVDMSLCPDEEVILNGITYDIDNPTGMDTIVNGSTAGCDSIIDVDLEFLTDAMGILNSVLCSGEEIDINGTIYNEANPMGTEVFIGAAANGCDSILDIDLSFENQVTFDLNPTLCPGEEVMVNGTIYNESNSSGSELFVNGSVAGCDSLVNIDLGFYPFASSDLIMDLCPGNGITINGTIYNENNPTGSEILFNASVNGCDSIVNVDLGFYPESSSDINMDLCPGDMIMVNGNVYDENNPSGTEMLIGASSNGCDSTVNVDLSFPNITIDIQNVADICVTPETQSFDLSVDVQGTVIPGEWSGIGIIDPIAGTFNPQELLSQGIFETDIFYTLINNGCDFEDQLNIVISGYLEANLGIIQATCNSESEVFISASFTSSSVQFSIDNGPLNEESDVIFGLDAGPHTIRFSNAEGCQYGVDFILDEVFMPFVDAGPDIELLLGDSEAINVMTDATTETISWEPTLGLDCSDCLNPTASPANTTLYTITIIDDMGCIISDDILVEVRVETNIYFPSSFSPNGDNINDYFYPQTSPTFTGTIAMSIFDRWGNLVFSNDAIEPNTPEMGWDGKYRNKVLDSGVYVYVFQIQNENGEIDPIGGDITLVK